jgi:hypothetical protein
MWYVTIILARSVTAERVVTVKRYVTIILARSVTAECVCPSKWDMWPLSWRDQWLWNVSWLSSWLSKWDRWLLSWRDLWPLNVWWLSKWGTYVTIILMRSVTVECIVIVQMRYVTIILAISDCWMYCDRLNEYVTIILVRSVTVECIVTV